MQRWIDAMEKAETRKAFGARIKQLRKQRGWQQKELADKLDVRFSQLNKYESGLHAPPLEKLVLLAEVLGTTVDFLLTGARPEAPPLHSTRLLRRFQALEELKAQDQEPILEFLDAMLLKRQMEATLARSAQR